jgi:predicted NBD/HSP70 family sugar kinase
MHEQGRKTVLFEIQKRRGRDRLTSGVWADALEAEDAVATELIGGAIAALGSGLASVQNLLALEAIIVGGGLGDRLGPAFVARVAAAMGPHLFVAERPPVVLPSELGDLGGARGAAIFAAELDGKGKHHRDRQGNAT